MVLKHPLPENSEFWSPPAWVGANGRGTYGTFRIDMLVSLFSVWGGVMRTIVFSGRCGRTSPCAAGHRHPSRNRILTPTRPRNGRSFRVPRHLESPCIVGLFLSFATLARNAAQGFFLGSSGSTPAKRSKRRIWRGAVDVDAADFDAANVDAAGAEAEVESGAGAEAKVCAEALAVASSASSSTACAPKGTVPGGRRRDMYEGRPLRYLRHRPSPLLPRQPPATTPLYFTYVRAYVGTYVRVRISIQVHFNSTRIRLQSLSTFQSTHLNYVRTYVCAYVRA